MSPQDELQRKRIRLARLRAFEDALRVVDSFIADAEKTAARTTVAEDVPRYSRLAEVLLKVRADIVAATYEED